MADETITVTSHTDADISVEVVNGFGITIEQTGPPGPQGEGLGDHLLAPDPHPQYLLQQEGDDRYATSGDLFFTYVQSTASTVWTITHPLPYKPNVTVVVDFGTGLEEVITDVSYPNSTTVVIEMALALTGEAYLS